MRLERTDAAFGAIFLVALVLRFHALDGVPGPAGDEGNWTLWALSLHRGEAIEMPANASFVSLAFARLIAFAFDVLGPSSAAARSVNALASLGAVLAVYLGSRALGRPRAALASAALLALHPYCVAWSRTVAVPYSLALFLTSAGSVLFLVGVEKRRGVAIALGIVLVSTAAHVSPLSIVAAFASAVVALRRDARFVLRSPWTALGLALGLAIAIVPVLGAVHAIAAVDPPTHPLTFAGKLARYLHMVLTGLAGEATLRHFGHAALPVALAPIAAVPFVVLVVIASRSPQTEARGILGEAGLVWLASALVLVPLVLSFGRNWYMPDIDRERYLFAFVPALALVVGDAGDRARLPFERGVLTLVLALTAIATTRLAVDALHGGGPDRGVDVFAGGEAYRGFRTSASHRAPAEIAADALARSLPRGSGVVLAEAAMRPIGFALLRRRAPSHAGHPAYFLAEAEYYPDPYTHTGELGFVIYVPEVFSAPTSPAEARTRNDSLRSRLAREYVDARRVETIRQPNGDPLLEVWVATRPDRPYAPTR